MIKIIEGDLFCSDARIIAHQVNCQGKMGSGVALQVKRKYPNVYNEYMKVCSTGMLGKIQIVPVDSKWNGYHSGSLLIPKYERFICNMFAQNNYGHDYNHVQYTNVEALEKSYAYISDHVRNIKGNYESAAQAYIDAVNTAHRMNESQENMLTTINDSMKHVVHTNEKVDEVIAVMEERQERIENLISHINEISTTIEMLQKLESQLNRIANK